MPELRARFVARTHRGSIEIRDAHGSKTVTNDAEAVVAWLAGKGFDLSLPVIYCDSEGRWDGIKVENGAFAGFVLIGGVSAEDALDVMRRW